MTVSINDRTIAVPSAGLIFHSVDLHLYNPARQLPANGKAVMMVMATGDGDLCWEHGEYHDGSDIWEEGWYLFGINGPLHEADYRVVLWCEEPELPNLQALGWSTAA